MKLCMIGTGYVGLVSGVCFSDLGNTVYCVDNNEDKIKKLNNGIVPIYEPGLEELIKKNYRLKRLIFTTDIKNAVSKADIIFMNTCAIREKAEETVHNRLDSIHYLKKKNPQLIFGVLGCMAQNLKNELLESKPYVDIILGPDSYRRIPEIINNIDL